MGTGRITEELVERLAEGAGLHLEKERLGAVTEVLGGLLAGLSTFENLDIDVLHPELVFDARW